MILIICSNIVISNNIVKRGNIVIRNIVVIKQQYSYHMVIRSIAKLALRIILIRRMVVSRMAIKRSDDALQNDITRHTVGQPCVKTCVKPCA